MEQLLFPKDKLVGRDTLRNVRINKVDHQYHHRCNHNWNVTMMKMAISLFSICGLLMSCTTAETTAHTGDDMQAVVSTQIPGNCSQVKCPPIETCPEDSYRLPSLVEPSRQGNPSGCCPSASAISQKCQCIPDLHCSPKECPKGWKAQASKNATGRPGGCCPKFVCLPSSSLGETKSNHHHYHHEPQKLHGALSSDINIDSSLGLSSSIEDADDELDDDLDDDEDSDEDLDANNEASQSHLNDQVDDGHCFHEGNIYKSGGSWTVQSDCTECFCEHGLVSCKPVTCEEVPEECRLARTQPLSCCHVCDGCISNSGKAYNMSETWQEDPCTNCTCQGGRIQCHVSMCKHSHSCANPKHFPGECCPRCENEPPDSRHLTPHDKESCPFRACHRDISCPRGFRLDKSGCPTCECQKCQSLLGCKLSCTHGFKVDIFGCTLCDCREDLDEPNNLLHESSSMSRNGNSGEKDISLLSSSSGSQDSSSSQRVDHSATSPSKKVDQRNLLGNPGNNHLIDGHDSRQYGHHRGNRYHHRDEDDETHEHDDDGLYGYGYGSNEAKSSSSRGAAPSVLVVLCTVDSDGVRRMEGEEWSDHCRRCVCRNGKEMCSLITCQAPKCEHPIFYPGDCCPRCPVEETSVSFSHVNVSVCLSTDGTERVEGEIWTLSSCLTCTCHSGQVFCAAPDCPPTPCANPKLVDCCLQCPTLSGDQGNKDGDGHSVTNSQTISGSQASSNRNCLSDDSITTYTDGETWKVGACQSCRCEDGEIQCFSAGKCPVLECPRPVLAKNQCCPICLDKGPNREKDGQRILSGEHPKLTRLDQQDQEYNWAGGVKEESKYKDKDDNPRHKGPVDQKSFDNDDDKEKDQQPYHRGSMVHKNSIQHGMMMEGFELHHVHNGDHQHHESPSSVHTTTSRGPGGGLETHCAVLIACLLVVTILLSLYIVRQVCFHRRVSRRLIKKVPVGFHSSSSSHSPSVTPDCCYKCDYSKYCDSGGCVIVGGSAGGCSSNGGGSSSRSSTNGSNGHLSSEQKPLFQSGGHHDDRHSINSSVIPNTPSPPLPPVLTQSLLRDSNKV